ncbi:hypothetical protein [Rhodococcus sp. LB1]|uniref:hypothetical protein n=1 Tax=Rhodococcus sp. LB1 TaxID=1807499 RepID=UPI00077B119F|nr:hypothetical protein [Rhodococcus sp. LB1]KXX58407.1 hypothetical protein AZG88_45915 [Rhodococcus sp. LB1]
MSTRYFKPIAVTDEVDDLGSVGILHADVGHTASFDAPIPRALEIPNLRLVGMTGTVGAVRTGVSKLQDTFSAYSAGSRTELIPPDRPDVPDPNDITAAAYPGDKRIGRTFALTRGFERLVVAEGKAEQQRTRLDFLEPFGGDDLHPLPLATVGAPA